MTSVTVIPVMPIGVSACRTSSRASGTASENQEEN
jgi:hypothetical protein